MNNNHDDSTNYYYFMSPPPSLSSKSSSLSLNTIIIALIVLFFVLAFCFFLSLYAKWYWSTHEDPFIVSWRGRVARQVAPAAPAVTRRRGLDRVTLRALPLVVYDPKDFKEGLECSVCLSEISLGEKVRLLPKCNHGFHVECIDMWFKSHSTCPLCRNSVSAFENQSITNDSSGPELHDDNSETDQSSDSDSNSDSDSDSDHEGGSRRGSVTLSFPTNVLYWGDEVQVRSLVGETTNDNNNVASSSSNNNNDNRQRDELVIEIPSDLCEDCFSTPRSSGRFREEEVKTPKTPVVSRLRSLRRLLSKGKSLAPWASSSNSTSTIENVEQV